MRPGLLDVNIRVPTTSLQVSRDPAQRQLLKDLQATADAAAVDSNPAVNWLRALSAPRPRTDHSLRLSAFLLAASTLSASALLLPSSAPARSRRADASTQEPAPVTPGEGAGAPGEATGEPTHSPAARAGRRGRCHLDAVVSPSPLTAGESASLAGTLTCPIPADAAEQTVTVYQRTSASDGFTAVGAATTEASGAFRFTTAGLDSDSSFYAVAQGVHSRRREVKVVPLVTISGPAQDTQLALVSRRAGVSAGAGAGAGNTVTFTGSVSPEAPGARVELQRESASIAENWHRIALAELGAGGTYSFTHTFGRPGSATVRVVVRARGLRPAASEPLTYEIARPQNPRLTIAASSAQLPYGQSLVLSGTAAGSPDHLLTLLARAPGGGFAARATVETDAAGNYAFPAESPLQDTIYEVAGAGTASIPLLARVQPLLTAQVSAASVQSGQALAFSGTLTPGHAGQAVYLQRQNPSGLGFHNVAVGALGEGGTYSIEHTVSGVGTQVFRVRVPGSEGAASPALKIQVTTASDEPLAPVAPGAGSTTLEAEA